MILKIRRDAPRKDFLEGVFQGPLALNHQDLLEVKKAEEGYRNPECPDTWM